MSRSSTSSSDARRAARRLALGAALTLALLAGLEAVVRVTSPFPDHGGWEHQQFDAKLGKLEAFVQAHDGVDAILTGNSMVMNIDVTRVEAAHKDGGLTMFNLGIGGLSPETGAFLLEHCVFPITTPAAIIYGIGPRDLRDTDVVRGRQPPLGSPRARALLRNGWQGEVERRAEAISHLVRTRHRIRDFLVRGGEPVPVVEIRINDHGVRRPYFTSLGRRMGDDGEFDTDHHYRDRYDRYAVYPEGRWRDLIRMIDLAKGRDVRFVLVNLPLSPAAFSLFDDRERDYALFLETVDTVVAETGVEYYDGHADLELTNHHFANADHTNSTGDHALAWYLGEVVIPGRRMAEVPIPRELRDVEAIRERYRR